MSTIDMLKQLGTLVKYSPDNFICYQGNEGENMFIILKGRVSVLVDSPVTGGMVEVAQLPSGSFVGEMSILEEMPRSANVKALEETMVLQIDRDHFKAFIGKQPSFAFKIMKSMSGRIRNLNEQLTSMESGGEIIEKEGEAAPPEPEETVMAQGELYPQGHKVFETPFPYATKGFIYRKPIKCPVCRNQFEVNNLRLSRLRIAEKRADFREIYKDFNKLWYETWTCPECLYSDYTTDFLTMGDKAREKLQPALQQLKQNSNIEFEDEPKVLKHVFTSYYLTLFCKKARKVRDFRIGKTWLNLAWLYEDANDNKMRDMAYAQAKENYAQVYYNTSMKLPPEEEWRLFMLMAELYLKDNDKKEALKFVQKAVMLRIKGRLGDDAVNKMDDLKQAIKKEEKEA